ncbi:transcriptional regulator [Enterobacter cloacae]|nr:transcriptional regulator [Enterobacter cloacae]
MPQHINIGTFDEHPMLGFLPNSVWSMQQDEDTWAEKAFELMQRAIDGEAVNETAKVDMKLVKRSRQ